MNYNNYNNFKKSYRLKLFDIVRFYLYFEIKGSEKTTIFFHFKQKNSGLLISFVVFVLNKIVFLLF